MILLLPILFGSGIGLYFLLPFEPPPSVLLAAFLGASALTLTALPFHKKGALLLFSITVIASGCWYMSYRAHDLHHPFEPLEEDQTIWIRGTLDALEKREHGHRIWLSDLDLWTPETKRFPPEQTPQRLRLNVRTDIEEAIVIGDRVAMKARLSNLPRYPVYPGGYDFAQYAFFERIGATGYTLSPMTKLAFGQKEQTLLHRVLNGRFSVTDRIHKAMTGQAEGAVASALLTGHRNDIPKETLEDFRLTGLGHLLAISGLHMALVMTGVYFLLRFLCALVPYIALHYPVKQAAAFLALWAGLGYLLLSGWPVSAQRAYIMVGMFFVAILINRSRDSMRPVAIAALVILLIAPHSVILPGFQMSFAAVIALIAVYQWWSERRQFRKERGMLTTLLLYVAGVLATSLIAGTATTPYALYHFGRFSTYNLLANLAAIPLTTFWILPAGMLGILLMPFGLEELGFVPMSHGLALLLRYAKWVVGLPESYLHIAQTPLWSVLLFTYGALWLLLIRSRVRYAGLVPVLLSCAVYFMPPRVPDMIIDETGRLAALKTSDNRLAFNDLRTGRFSRNEWLKAVGLENPLRIKDLSTDVLRGFSCNAASCLHMDAPSVLMVFPAQKPPDCKALPPQVDLLIQLADELPCPVRGKNTVTRQLPAREGTVLITRSPQVKITTMKDVTPVRLWTGHTQISKE